jgi:histidinol-phosphate aminotransferase
VVTRSAFNDFMARLPDHVVVVVDEAYIEFAKNPDCLKTGSPADLNRPLVTLRTFSKVYGLAGLRVGYGIMPAELAGFLHRVRQPFNVNALAQAAAAAALDDRDFLRRSIRLVHDGLESLYADLDRLGLVYFKTESNFFLIDVGAPADDVFEKMLRQGVIVRSMRAYGYPHYIRVNVGLEKENRRFIQALKTVLQL